VSQPQKPNQLESYTYATNRSSTAFAFKERLEYKESIIPSLDLNYEHNFWGREQFYGRVNQAGEPIYVQESQLKALRYSSSPTTALAINFVADAWRDFVDRIADESNTGILFKDGPYYNPRVLKAWRSASSQYHDYLIETMFPSFVGVYLPRLVKRGKKITGVKSFLQCLDGFAIFSAKSGAPMTFSSYMTSAFCSILNTGLAIEISPDPHDQDFQKIRKFLYDGNFARVRQIASEYGFIIDPNAPWRFVADLGSKPMIEYMVGVTMFQDNFEAKNQDLVCDDINETVQPRPEPYGFSSIPGLESVVRHARGYGAYGNLTLDSDPQEVYRSVFRVAYQKTWRNDMDYLTAYMVQFYNAYVEKKPQTVIPAASTPEEIRAGCIRTNPTVINLIPVSLLEFKRFFGDKWGLLSYYRFRSIELGVKKSFQQERSDVKRFMDIFYKTRGNMDYKYIQSLSFIHDQLLMPVMQESLTMSKQGVE